MRTSFSAFLILLVGVPSANLLSQEYDLFGYTNYSWGKSFQEIIDFYEMMDFDYKLEVDTKYPAVKRLAAEIYAPHQPYKPRVIKGFGFYRDSLVQVFLAIHEYDEHKRDKLYHWVKQILVEMYQQSPSDTLAFQNTPKEILTCQWEFDSTTVVLAKRKIWVYVLYHPKNMTEEVSKALMNKKDF